MGNTDSTLEAIDVLDEVSASGQAPQAPGIRLYYWVTVGTQGKWEKVSANAHPQFYDVNEDNNKPPEWHLEIEAADIDAPVDLMMNPSVKPAEQIIYFIADHKCYCMKFPTAEAFEAFHVAFNSKQFENTYGLQDNSKNRDKVLGKDYADTLFNVGADSEDMEVEIEEQQEDDVPEAAELREKKMHREGEDPIHGILMGALENSYVLRGTQVDVMRNTVGELEDKEITFDITPVKGGPSFTPSKVVMANAERYMNMITPTKPTSLFQTDIEYQKVVSEWSFAKDQVDIPIKDISSDHKSAQLEETSTFLGLDNNRLARWDLRTSAGVVEGHAVASYEGGKDYSRGTNFNCMATSGDGYVVVGSDDGKVRLYSNRSLNRAITSLPGLGAAVTAVDVTFNGEWVLATTDNYLMLIRAIFKGKGGVEMNGFKKSIGKSSPKPILLKLKPQDHMRTKYKPLQKAKFTWVTEEGKHERLIVANVGNYSVLWNFHTVRNAASSGMVSLAGLPACQEYRLVAKEEDVVECAFMHDNFKANEQDSMVLVTQHDIFNLS